MPGFSYQGLPTRVVFGWGALGRLSEEIERIGAKRALVLTTPEQEKLGESVAALVGARAVGVHPQAVMHVPVEVAEAARAEAERLGADSYIAVGGGSTIGLGKAIALISGQPIIAVPTTYAGSEMTPIYGLTEGRMKRTGRDFRVLPNTVVYDPELTLTLPVDMSASSGMNAVAHAVEALYAPDTNPIVGLMAEESIRVFARVLPQLVSGPKDRNARTGALYAAWLAGTCLGSVAMSLHHKLCHTLGGTFNLPHAQTHAAVIPHAAHYNHRAAPDALARVAKALGGNSAEDAGPLLYALNRALGLEESLEKLGLPFEGVAEVARITTENPYANPEPIALEPIRVLLERAWRGQPPA